MTREERSRFAQVLFDRANAHRRQGLTPFQPIEPGDDDISLNIAYLSEPEKDAIREVIALELAARGLTAVDTMAGDASPRTAN